MKYIWLLFTFIICLSFINCAIATKVPNNATTEQIEQINAKNLVVIAKNTTTIIGLIFVLLLVIIASLLILLFWLFFIMRG